MQIGMCVMWNFVAPEQIGLYFLILIFLFTS